MKGLLQRVAIVNSWELRVAELEKTHGPTFSRYHKDNG
jgi:hypothetical protein